MGVGTLDEEDPRVAWSEDFNERRKLKGGPLKMPDVVWEWRPGFLVSRTNRALDTTGA